MPLFAEHPVAHVSCVGAVACVAGGLLAGGAIASHFNNPRGSR